MKRYYLLLIMCLALSLFASEPAGYYNSANNTADSNLRGALRQIIQNHTVISYSALWTLYGSSDLNSNGNIWDMYSTCTFQYQTKQCGNYVNVCDCYNREHSVPKSWFNNISPLNSDAFHIYPTDGKVNAHRGNYSYGECSGGVSYDNREFGKLGISTFNGYSGTVFEPDNEYKGDFARGYFYMITRYADDNFTFAEGSSCFTYNTSETPKANLTPYAISLFLKWHRQDPISQKEISRNEAIYSRQNNRNPFVDHPELAEYIWGNRIGQIWNITSSLGDIVFDFKINVYPNPAKDFITIETENRYDFSYQIYNITSDLVKIGDSTSGNQLDVNDLSNGYYILKIKINNSLFVKKIVIVK